MPSRDCNWVRRGGDSYSSLHSLSVLDSTDKFKFSSALSIGLS